MTTQQAAQAALAKTRKKLATWLSYRDGLRALAEGRTQGKYGQAVAAEVRRGYLISVATADEALALRLHAFLTEAYPGAVLPEPSASSVDELARYVVSGKVPVQNAAGDLGFIPFLIAGVAAVAVIGLWAYFSSRADVDIAKSRDSYCLASGNCTDDGAYVKWALIGLGAYLVWTKTDLPNVLSNVFSKTGSAISSGASSVRRRIVG